MEIAWGAVLQEVSEQDGILNDDSGKGRVKRIKTVCRPAVVLSFHVCACARLASFESCENVSSVSFSELRIRRGRSRLTYRP